MGSGEFRIEGGAPLTGVVEIPGSKNAALAVLSAVMLCPGKVTLINVPKVSDTRIKCELIRRYGAHIEWEGNVLTIDSSHLENVDLHEDEVRPIRTSFYLLGSLIARMGDVRLPSPGGCKIGERPVDYHVKGLQMMGAEIDLEGGIYHARTTGLKGAEIYLDFPSAGATQHLMSSATVANGNTVIQNAATEPEVVALAAFLKKMGANIEGEGTATITIQGVEELKPCEFRIPEDRIQAGTYLLAGAITRGSVTAQNIMPEYQIALGNKLREAGADVQESNDSMTVSTKDRLHGIRVKTMPYPGFPTDIQQPMCAALALASGSSSIEETIYESRTGHVSELNRMGAEIRTQGRTTSIEGVSGLKGAVVEASDLRAGAALVLAGLAAEGETVVRNIHFIDRGYQDFEERLTELGGTIRRVHADANARNL